MIASHLGAVPESTNLMLEPPHLTIFTAEELYNSIYSENLTLDLMGSPETLQMIHFCFLSGLDITSGMRP